MAGQRSFASGESSPNLPDVPVPSTTTVTHSLMVTHACTKPVDMVVSTVFPHSFLNEVNVVSKNLCSAVFFSNTEDAIFFTTLRLL